MDRITVPKKNNTRRNLTVLLTAALIVGSARFAGFSIIETLLNLIRGGRLLGRMFLSPAWDYAPRVVDPLLETIRMSLVGTSVGALFDVPAAVFAAENLIRKPFLNKPLLFILNIVRTIPSLVLASLFVAVFGTGPFSGVLALSIFTFGLISKLTFETDKPVISDWMYR